MRRIGTVIILLLSLITLRTFVAAQTTTISPPGIRYALGGSAGGINNLVVSANGQTFASASSDGTVKIWQMSDGMLLHTYATPSAQPLCVALSPDGTTVAVGDSYERIWMWNLANDSIVRMFTAFNYSSVTSIAYSPDGSTLAAAGADSLSSGISYTIKLYSAANGKLLETLDGHGNQITQIAYSPAGGSVLVSASLDHTVRIWNTGTGQTTTTINAFTAQGPTCVAISNDGTHVAAGGVDKKYPYNFAKVWNVVGGSSVVKINAYTSSGVTAVAFSPDGTLLATGGEDTINGTPIYLPKTFSVPAGQLVNSFLQHNNTVQALVFSNDGGTLISGGLDYQIIQWNVSTGLPANFVTQFLSTINSMAFSSDGSQMALATADNYSTGTPASIQLCAVADGSSIWTFPGYAPFNFSADGTLFAYTPSSYPTILNLNNETTLRTFTTTSDLVWFSPNDQTFYNYDGSNVNAWRMSDGTLLSQTQVSLGTLGEFSTDTTRLVSYAYNYSIGGYNVYVWSMPAGTLLQTLPNSPYYPYANDLAISGGGNYVAFALYNAPDAYIYRVSDGMLMLDQPGASGTTASAVAMSPFGDSVATARSDGSVTVTRIDGQLLAYWNDQLGTGVNSIRYTPDGTSLVLARNDNTLLVCYNPAPAALASLTLNQSIAAGGSENPQGTVTISLPAPTGGVPIALSSSNPAVAAVPSTVVIKANSTSASFPVTTSAVTAPTVVTLSGVYNGLTQSVNLTVNPSIAPKALSFAPATIQGGGDAVGVVTLKAPAYAGGVVVALSSPSPSIVTVPATVTVPAGATSLHFPVQTGAVTSTSAVSVTAITSGTTVKGTINVCPATVAGLLILPPSVQGGVENAVGIVTLTAPTDITVTVTLSVTTTSTAGDVTYPTTVTIPPGSFNGVFDIGTNAPKTASDKVTFMAQIGVTKAPGTTSKTANLTVTH